MLDIKFIRENPDIVKENIKKKFQDEKLPWWTRSSSWTASAAPHSEGGPAPFRPANTLSKQVGMLMGRPRRTQQAGRGRGCKAR